MSLDVHKLEKARELGDGGWQARCPACAEAGQDRTGEHLRIYSDGKFGCCVHPGDVAHRRRIFALAGERKRSGIQVKAAGSSPRVEGKRIVFGKLKFANAHATDGPDGVSEVETQIHLEIGERTPRTGENQSSEEFPQTAGTSRTVRTGEMKSSGELFETTESLRTLRTPQYPYICTDEESLKEKNTLAIYKESSTGVRSVRQLDLEGTTLNAAGELERTPFFAPDGTLVIPFDSPARYHWWKEGQTIAQTRAEVLELQRKESDATAF